MAAFYAQRPPPSASRVVSSGPSRVAREDRANSSLEPLSSADVIPADHSIYIFPNPSSAPPSPIPPSPGSSLFSAPTDFETSESYTFTSRERTISNAPSTATSPPPEGGAIRRRVPPLPDDEMEIDVEVWDLSTDPDAVGDISDSDSSWVPLESEVERAAAAGIDLSFLYSSSRAPRRTHKLSAPPSPDTAYAHAQQYWAVRQHRRSRTHSRIRTISSLSSRAPSARRPAPSPRIHIPLLSFISSFLSIDMDDPALRLLTHTDPGEAESVLFPGHTTAHLLGQDAPSARAQEYGSGRDMDTDSSSSEDEEPHGLPRLLLASLSDQSTIALRSLREGLAVYIPHSPDFGLPIPHPTEVFELWRVVGQVCARSSQAWKEVWRGAGLDSRSETARD